MEPTIEDELQKLAAEVPEEEWKGVPRSDDKLVPLARVLALVEGRMRLHQDSYARLLAEGNHNGADEFKYYVEQCEAILRLLREEFEQE